MKTQNMNKIVKILILFLIACSFISVTFAHPGKLDKYGCHVCRKNCKKWGLRDGQYHCHKSKNYQPIKSK
jgi:hypothetical protein